MAEARNEAVTRQVLDRLVRRERGRLIAGLVRRLGGQNLALAEDVAQDAILRALGTWPYQGLPQDPTAWLARVARNKAIDRLRRAGREVDFDEESQSRPPLAPVESAVPRPSDPEVELIFLSCHPAIGGIDRLALTLRIVGGFTARELAQIFLVKDAAIAQRLSRSRRALAELSPDALVAPAPEQLQERLGAVQRVIYLMFSLGYAPRSGASLIRRDIALEALRLATHLCDGQGTATPESFALAALLSFQASRFGAREDDLGRPILLAEQDRSAWDRALIERGLRYLAEARSGISVSRYHLEAAIAACHALAPSWEAVDWPLIRSHYARLEELTGSPVVAINSAVARAFAGDPERALATLEEIERSTAIEDYAPFHIARAEIQRLLGRERDSESSYRRAIASGASSPVIAHLEERLATSL